MPLRNLLYLLQLEEYDLSRFKNWLKNDPGKIVTEKKGRLNWTIKARAIFLLARFFSLFLPRPDSFILSVRILSPVDSLLKKIVVILAKIKLFLVHRNLIVIGITGSWGKTTLKERLYDLLKNKYRVSKTEVNNNTLLGIAKTIFLLKRNEEIFIAEMAAYKRGEIKEICLLVRPKIGIITVIGPMHLERFGTLKSFL